MAQPTDTYSTHQMIGIREDLANVIYDVSPTEVPFLSMAKKGTATSTNVEWQTDTLAQASDSNFVIEGDDASANAGVATVRRGNYTAISDKVAITTGTAQAVDTAGRANEHDYQVLKRAKELKRDIETILLANNAKVAGNDSTARETAGLPAWLISNVDRNGGANPTGDGTDARTDGTQRAFTEDQFKTVIQSIWTNGGNPTVAMMGGFNRQIASSFSGGNSGFQKAEDKTLHATYDVYESDFAQIKLVPNRFMPTRNVYILDMDYWEVAFMTGRNMVTSELAKTGDSKKTQVLAEYALKALNEKSSGIVADLTTA
jgi:hypothetical protein